MRLRMTAEVAEILKQHVDERLRVACELIEEVESDPERRGRLRSSTTQQIDGFVRRPLAKLVLKATDKELDGLYAAPLVELTRIGDRGHILIRYLTEEDWPYERTTDVTENGVGETTEYDPDAPALRDIIEAEDGIKRVHNFWYCPLRLKEIQKIQRESVVRDRS